jgi:phosphoglycolate phosphatase-like HAD superfamily hydrolase
VEGRAGVNTREEIASYKPRKEFFAGIDSDGTAFDSMNIKHLNAFLPAALLVWDFAAARAAFENIWTRLNLYSQDRGINRFSGLVLAFEQLRAEGADAPDAAPLRAFTEQSAALSNASLEAWMRDHPHPFLDEVFRWSCESDRLFGEHTRGLLPFKNVDATLGAIAERADVMVVSSASGRGLDKDWTFAGLTQYTALVAGQEAGSKRTQLWLGAFGKYPADKILMIGDAPGDLDAARSIDALFYPIIPGREAASWLRLQEEGLIRFFAGTWRDAYGDALVQEFMDSLG